MKSPKTDAPDALLQESQRRVGELTKALQTAYSWGYTSGKLSELGEILTEARVLRPQEIVTRFRMIEVWEEGCEKFPGERSGAHYTSNSDALSWVLHYASSLPAADQVPKEMVREWLWKLANAAAYLLSENFDALPRTLEEYARAAKKHPGMTLECDGHTDASRLFALVEEIGEVAACLTYDNNSATGHNSDLESEVVQVIALALAWATRYLDD